MLKMSHEALGKMCRSRAQLHRARLSLFSELMATKVALLSLCSSIGIPRNAVIRSCLEFPLLPTAEKDKKQSILFYSLFPPVETKTLCAVGSTRPQEVLGVVVISGSTLSCRTPSRSCTHHVWTPQAPPSPPTPRPCKGAKGGAAVIDIMCALGPHVTEHTRPKIYLQNEIIIITNKNNHIFLPRSGAGPVSQHNTVYIRC